jgi:hypothetical protein
MGIPRRRIIVAASIGVLLLAFVVTGLYRLQEQADALELVMSGNPTTEQLIKFLGSGNPTLLDNTLTILEQRKATGGRESAARLLKSDNLYVWFCASLYLGAIGDERSIPYLIRGLSHPARNDRTRVVSYLKNMTGNDFGENKEEWVRWWVAQHGKSFDFTCSTNIPLATEERFHW